MASSPLFREDLLGWYDAASCACAAGEAKTTAVAVGVTGKWRSGVSAVVWLSYCIDARLR